MKRIHIQKVVYIYIFILSVPLILLLLIQHYKHHSLIHLTYDFIVVAKRSGRVSVFVTCNVIIVTILFGFKSFVAEGSAHEVADGIQKGIYGGFEDDEYDHDDDVEEFHGYDGYDEDNDDDVDSEDDDSVDYEMDDNDLHVKIDEFIDKVYRTWKEEMVSERLLCIAATEFN